MAYLEMTTKELAKIVRTRVSNDIKKITGISNGFSFEADIDHGFPLVPSKIPFLVEFTEFSKDQLKFELNINKPLKIVTSKILSLVIKKFEEELPEGVYFEKNYIKIKLDKVIDKEFLDFTITDFSLENSKIQIKISL